MGKVSKKKSRSINRGSRKSNEDLEHSRKNVTDNNSNNSQSILSNLNSIDIKKRLNAITMLSDLLSQHKKNAVILDKLISTETLSSLSMRIIDSNVSIRTLAIKCFLTITRCGIKYTEKIISLGIHQSILQMLYEISNSEQDFDISNDDLIDDILCIIRLLTLYYPLIFAENQVRASVV